MALIIEKKDRRLIPNWRDFSTTVSLGELDSPSTVPMVKPNLSINDYIEDFQENKTIPFAADLISASLVNGLTYKNEVKEAAKFIIDSQGKATKSQYDISKCILSTDKNIGEDLTDNTTIAIENCLNKNDYNNQIKFLKKLAIDFPYNSVIWVELSRCYSIIGQESQSVKCMKIAVQLAPDNRFVLRCAVRLFSHYDEIDIAHDILRKSRLTNFDPWLTSAEISIAMLKNKSSKFIKRGIELVDSDKLSPFSITELASSIATLELLSGNRKKSKKMFGKSLINPNDNSLAQMEWILSDMDKSLINREMLLNIKIKHNFEAQTIANFNEKKLPDAFDNACLWFRDMPFSKRPVIIGSTIANILDKRNLSIEFLKKGLIANPNDTQILNNLAYYFALDDNIKDALNFLEKAKCNQIVNKTNSLESIDICIMATQGLIYFRQKKYDKGRDEYLKAIEKAKSTKDNDFIWTAMLNYAREEILANTENAESIMQIVSKIPKIDENSILIKKLHSDVLALYEQQK